MSADTLDYNHSYTEASDEGLRVLKAQFSTFSSLSAEDEQVLGELAQTSHYHPPHRNLYARDFSAPPLRIVTMGWGCRYRLLPDGRRQIINLCLPGDFIGHVSSMVLPAPCATGALTEMQTVSAKAIVDILKTDDPRHAALIHGSRVMCHFDDIMMCDHVVCLGRQTGAARLAHLILRLHERLTRVGLANGNQFSMPLTQEVLADILGQSVVHMNRVIRELRHSRLLDFKGGIVDMLDPDRLRVISSWIPLPVKAVRRNGTDVAVPPRSPHFAERGLRTHQNAF